jgi:hypothetical protein
MAKSTSSQQKLYPQILSTKTRLPVRIEIASNSFLLLNNPLSFLTFLILLVSKNLSVDDLKKIQEWLLHQVYNTSNTLVELLQERHQLSEQAHMRLISIEQLHRLLEARCFYRRLTGLFS